jgi:DNA-binding transcriptional regulator YhcF (GntR family)
MKKTLLAFHPSHPKGVRWQIADYLRTLIAAGELTADQQLPATHILVRQWGTNVATVQGAMSLLVKEGLIWRAPKRGTFVRKREARLTQVAVYYTEDALFLPTYGYRPALHRQIKDVLSRDGVATDVWVDPRPFSEQADTWPELARAATDRRVQAVTLAEALVGQVYAQRRGEPVEKIQVKPELRVVDPAGSGKTGARARAG